MKNLMAALMFVGITSVAMAAPACTAPTPNITTFFAGCEAGNMLFSNFVYTPTGGAGPATSVSSIPIANGNVTFNTNPNQGSSVNSQESILTFTVATLDINAFIIGASSSNGGNGTSTVRQVVCAGTISATGVCTGTLLQDVTNAGGTATPTQSFAGQNTVSVWRDINTPINTAVTAASFDFTATPEPIAFVLMGSGLVGLALFRKRRAS